MRKNTLVFSGLLALAALFGWALGNNLDIRRQTRWIPPSREARENPFLALDRWLAASGHSVSVVYGANSLTLANAAQKTVIIQSSGVDWIDETVWETIRAFVREGGSLVLALDVEDSREEPPGLADFLASLGLQSYYRGRQLPDENSPETGNAPPESPDFSPTVAFRPIGKHAGRAYISFQRDSDGVARLAHVSLGKGRFTVLGYPLFMLSDTIGSPANARLAWELSGARDPEAKGVLFVRKAEEAGGLYAELRRRGDPLFLGISGAVLIILGFWAAVPVFGRVIQDEERPGRPLRERFLAEARFLKRFGGLHIYLEAYIREVRLKFRKREGDCEEAAFASRLAEISGLDIKTVENALVSQSGPRFREFLRRRETLTTILERLR